MASRDINTAIMDELLSLPTDRAEDELCGYLGALRAHDEPQGLVGITTPRLTMMRRILKLFKDLNSERFNVTNNEGRICSIAKRGTRAFVLLPVDLYRAIRSVPHAKPEARAAWLRGVWGAVGAMHLPQNGYYMYMRVASHGGLSDEIRAELRHIGVDASTRRTGGRIEITVRDQEGISIFFSVIGAMKSVLALEETAIVRSLKSRANKLVNCDTANIGKTVSAARAQLALVDRLDALDIWDAIPPRMAELARLRKANPSATLRELGQMTDDKVSKSTVEYRWKKLEDLIQKIGSNEGDGRHVLGKGRRQHLR